MTAGVHAVTGASGFIGSHLVEALVGAGFPVRAVLRTTSSLRWVSREAEVVRVSSWDVGCLTAALRGAHVVFHVAGVTHACSQEEFMAFHRDGTRLLLEACCQASTVERVVVFSSLAACGPSRDGVPLTEDCPAAPVSWYGHSKLAQEEVARSFSSRLSVVVVRPPAVYGPRDADFLPLFRACSRGLLPAPRGGTQSLTHVRDVVLGALCASQAVVPSGSTYFIASREIVTWPGLAQVLARVLGRPVRVVPLPPSSMALLGLIARLLTWGTRCPLDRNKVMEARFPHWVCLPLRAERELGFRPRVDLEEGLRETVAWYRGEGLL